MANPSRQQIIEAYEALEELRDGAREQIGLTADAKYDTILEVLPSKPELTMADVEWRDSKHYLAEAEHTGYGKVVMLRPDGPRIVVWPVAWAPGRSSTAAREHLTLTGRKYELKEINNG